jgi:hypothetical protein
MIARRRLTLALILIAAVPAVSAQIARSLLSHVGSSSFWIDVPSGWTANTQAAKKHDAVFVLLPAGANSMDASTSITCRYYKNMVQTVAMHRYKRLPSRQGAQFVQLSLTGDADPRISVEEIRGTKFPPAAVAFIPLGSDVLSIEFRAPVEEAYQRDLGAFLDMIESYEEAETEATQRR